MATGIMQISPARFTGALADTLPQYVPPLPVAGATGRWEADRIRQDVDTDVTAWPGVDFGPILTTGGVGISATAPTLIVGTGGTPSVQFDGVSDALGVAQATPQPNTVVAVAAVKALTGGITTIVSGGFDGVNIAQVLGVNSSGRARAYDGASLDLTAAGAIGTGLHVWLAVYNGASSVIRVDATEATGSAGTNNQGGNLNLATYGSGFANVEIKSVIYYPFALDATQRSDIVTALRDRHGI